MANIHVRTGKTNINIGLSKVYPRLVDLEVTPKVEEQVFTHEGEYGYDTVTIQPIKLTLQDKIVKPQKHAQIVTPDDHFDALKSVTVEEPILQDKEVTPSEVMQYVSTDGEFLGLNTVVVNPIPDEYVKVDGTLTITKNGEYDVSKYEGVITDVHDTSSIKEKDINFFDYDGTLLYAWGLEELVEKEHLPDLPTQDGLICQGWNWTLDDLKLQNTPMDVGATYTTIDGKTRIYIRLEEGRLSPTLGIGQSISNGVEIDWGDGYTETSNNITGSTSSIDIQHTYPQEGDYIITLTPLNNCTIYFIGTSSLYSKVLWNGVSSNSSFNRVYQNVIQKIELGQNIYLNNYALHSAINMKTINLPNGVQMPTGSVASYIFQNNYSLKFICFPKGLKTINGNICAYCKSFKNISLPKEITKIPGYFVNSCPALRRITLSNSITELGNNCLQNCEKIEYLAIPDSVRTIGSNAVANCFLLKTIEFGKNPALTTIQNSALSACTSLRDFKIPTSVTFIYSSAFSTNYSLSVLKIPKSITTLSSSCFSNMYSMFLFDFSEHTSIPTMQNANVFSNIPDDCKIAVPDDLYDEWVTAPNWSTYVDHIVKTSELN